MDTQCFDFVARLSYQDCEFPSFDDVLLFFYYLGSFRYEPNLLDKNSFDNPTYNWLSAYRKIYPWWDGKDATWKSQVVNPNKKAAQKASKSKQKLGLILVLGSRCDVLKSYTHLWPKDFKNLVIVNLQKTSKDHLARIKVHAKCDEFLELVYKELHVLESADWEIPDLSEEERENYYTPTDVPEYSLRPGGVTRHEHVHKKRKD